MGILLQYHAIAASILLSAVFPFWMGKNVAVNIKLSLQTTSKVDGPLILTKSSDRLEPSVCGPEPKLAGQEEEVCRESPEIANTGKGTIASPAYSLSTSEACCTIQQLMISIPQYPRSRLTTLDDLKRTALAVSESVGLDILVDSFYCSDQGILRCLTLSGERGYFSISKRVDKAGDAERRNPLLVDFHPPAVSKLTIQEMIERVVRLFSLSPRDQSRVIWHQFERGFRYIREKNGGNENEVKYYELDNPWVVDMSNLLHKQNKIYKRHVAHVKTSFQVMDIYDSVDTHVHPVVVDGETLPMSEVMPDREVYFDSIMQSRKRGLEAYHETLVHPLMLAHEKPRRVAIFGGGEGGTLREVLKHNTVEEVVMIEIDEGIVDASRLFLQEWNDCSDLVSYDSANTSVDSRYNSCYDDPRSTLYFEDAIGWFVSRFFNRSVVGEEVKFDVIILDSLDPGSMLEFSDFMYGNLDFAKALRGALRKGGILGGQVGIEKEVNLNDEHDWIRMIQNLKEAGFFALKDYMEGGGGFDDPWKFFVAPTDAHGLSRWFHGEAQVDLDIARRATATRSGISPFKYFDGPSMAYYQAPSRVAERLFCNLVSQHDVWCERGSLGGIPKTGISACTQGSSAIAMPPALGLILNGSKNHLLFKTFSQIPWDAFFYYGESAAFVGTGKDADLGRIKSLLHGNLSQSEAGLPFYNPSLHRHHWSVQACGFSEE